MTIQKRFPLRSSLIIFTLLWIASAADLHAQEKIRIGISTASLGFLPTVVAEKKGFYAKYGLMPEHVLGRLRDCDQRPAFRGSRLRGLHRPGNIRSDQRIADQAGHDHTG